MLMQFLFPLSTQAQPLSNTTLTVNWVKYINPTEGIDLASGTCLFGDYVAIVGFANQSSYPFVVLLNKSTGNIEKTWRGESPGWFISCLSVGDALYAVGLERINEDCQGIIYVFDKNLNVVKKVQCAECFSSIAYDGEYFYIGGIIGNFWCIEKRTIDLDLVKYTKVRAKSWVYGEIVDVGVNPATDEVWAVGWYWENETSTYHSATEHSLLVIFDKELREIKRIDYSQNNESYFDWFAGVSFDGSGNAYVVGKHGIAEFDPSGTPIAIRKDIVVAKTICIGSRVYGFGNKYIDGHWKQVIYVFGTGLNILSTYVLNKDLNASSYFNIGRPSFDGRSIYVAGSDEALGEWNDRWVVYSIPVVANVVVQVVDGFGVMRNDWLVEIVGVAAGRGQVIAELVEGQQYVARATGLGYLGYTNTTIFTAKGPQMVVIVKIPTAKLIVHVLDDEKKPIDRYVTFVDISGPLCFTNETGFVKPPKSIELLAGQYVIKVSALGKEASMTVMLNSGEVKNVSIIVPGTAGLDVFGNRIFYSTLALYGVATVAVVAAAFFFLTRRHN